MFILTRHLRQFMNCVQTLKLRNAAWEREEFEDYAERLAESEARLAESEARLADALAQQDAALSEKAAAIDRAKKYREWAIDHGYKEN